MSKKVLVIVGLAAVIAVSTGVITMTATHERGKDHTADKDNETVVDTVDDNDDNDDTGSGDTGEQPSDAVTESAADAAETQPATDTGGDDTGVYGDSIISHSFNIAYVVDHTTGDRVTARNVFGSLYYECYLEFKNDGTFELCLNPVADEIRTGSYKIYGDVISVEYSSGGGAEFSIISDGSGGVDAIMVNYGDYDVYFG